MLMCNHFVAPSKLAEAYKHSRARRSIPRRSKGQSGPSRLEEVTIDCRG